MYCKIFYTAQVTFLKYKQTYKNVYNDNDV